VTTTDHSLRQLQWRCRRGMRELDVLLGHYLQTQYVDAGVRRQRAFADLLEMADPDIHAMVLGGAIAEDEAVREVVDAIARAAR